MRMVEARSTDIIQKWFAYFEMISFAKRPGTVDAVLKFLETHIPYYDDKRESLEYDIKAYYYCYVLISLSDYRQEDCEKLLWDTISYFIEKDKDRGILLSRNMKVLEHTRPFLTPMKEKLEEAQNISFLK